MPTEVRVSILFVLLCMGCDTAAKQQQADNARQAATVVELKQLGEAMHEKQNKELAPAGTPDEAAQDLDESNQDESVPASVAEGR